MKKLLTLIALATITAHAATNDLAYLQKNSSGKTVERVVTLTPSTFLSVNGSGQLQVQSSSAFLSAIGGATAAQGAKADTALQPGAAATTLNMATARILGRTTASSGAVEELTAAQVKTLLAITSSDVSNFTTAVQTVGDARYPQLSGSYADPAWITSLAWSKLTGVPVFLTPTGDGSGLTNLNASVLASGTVPDARFPATLPAASGANLTALNASNLGSGTVPAARLTSANLPNITLTLSGVLHTSPVTISGGSGTALLANQNANLIFAGPSSGGAAAPTFRSMVAADLPAATTSAQGATILASDAEIQAGTDTAKSVRPSGLAAWWTWIKTQAQSITAIWTFPASIEFEGATADAYETTLTATDPTADRTVTLFNASFPIAFPLPGNNGGGSWGATSYSLNNKNGNSAKFAMQATTTNGTETRMDVNANDAVLAGRFEFYTNNGGTNSSVAAMWIIRYATATTAISLLPANSVAFANNNYFVNFGSAVTLATGDTITGNSTGATAKVWGSGIPGSVTSASLYDVTGIFTSADTNVSINGVPSGIGITNSVFGATPSASTTFFIYRTSVSGSSSWSVFSRNGASNEIYLVFEGLGF